MIKATKTKKKFFQLILNVLIVLLLFMMIYPLAMAIWCSVKSDIGYMASKWYPTLPLRVANIINVFADVWPYVKNTLIVGILGVSGCLIISSLAAYALSCMQFPGKGFLYSAVIVLMMVPGVLTLVPSYALYRDFHLLNSFAVLIIPIMIGGSVFGVFLLTTFFSGLPREIFEAAQIDGASEFQCYHRIAIPLSMPIMATLAIMRIVDCWNDYIWPMITIQDADKLTISAGLLVHFTKQYSSNMPMTFAGYLVASLPLILLFIFANRYYVEGLINSSIKM